MKIISLNANGTFKCQWLPWLHGNNIPNQAIQVSDHVFMELSQNPYTKKYDEETESAVDFTQPFSIHDAFLSKTIEIRAGFQAAVQAITTTYTQEEISTFLTQENEALAWQADNNAPTPGIDYIVANRPSVDKATLVGRIITNASTYKDIVFPAMGKKQAYEDELYALQLQHEDSEQPDVTQADIDAIVVDFS